MEITRVVIVIIKFIALEFKLTGTFNAYLI